MLKEELMRLERIPEDPRRKVDSEKPREIKMIEDLTKKLTEKQLEKKMMTEWLAKMYEKLIAVNLHLQRMASFQALLITKNTLERMT